MEDGGDSVVSGEGRLEDCTHEEGWEIDVESGEGSIHLDDDDQDGDPQLGATREEAGGHARGANAGDEQRATATPLSTTRARRQGRGTPRSYDEVRRRGPRNPRRGTDAPETPRQQRARRPPALVRQIEIGTRTVARIVGGRYEWRDGNYRTTQSTAVYDDGG